jgi:2-polyprenyl-6-methoxyphenol hydroxylase-like FAD-dependent oxidoreductase
LFSLPGRRPGRISKEKIMKVLIAGAGLGGLCLAHGLRQDGVDVQVLERRPTPADQPSSYGIHLNANGLGALHACLPAANWEQLAASAVPARDIVRFYDQQLKTLAVLDHEAPGNTADPITQRRAISRGALRDALLLGLNTQTRGAADVVQWGRAFAGYEPAPDGRVTARCADGSQVTADLLVGADGSNSRVRAQRLPGLGRQELGIINIAGRVPLTPEIAAQVPGPLVDGAVNNVVPSGPGWMFVSTWHADSPGAAAPSFAVWAWAAARSSYPADIDNFAPQQLRDLVSGQISGWSPALRRLVAATDPATVSAVPLRTMPALGAWQPSNVTLLGDAIHNMTPMAGIGANTALRDADHLRRALTAPGAAGTVDRVGSYEEQMRGYANQALALSTRNARSAASTERLPRLAFRTVLRIAEAMPPVKRKIFGTVSLAPAR